jgi:hypothetical protein
LSRTVFHGKSASFWNTMPTRSGTPRTGAPSTSKSPPVTGTSPAIALSSVDLPQPLGPTIATNSPAATSKLARSTATVVRPRAAYAMWTSRSAIIGGAPTLNTAP